MSSTSSDSKTTSKSKHVDIDLTNKTTTDLHLDLLVDKSKLKDNYDKKNDSDSSSTSIKRISKKKNIISDSSSSVHQTYGHSDVLHSLKNNMNGSVHHEEQPNVSINNIQHNTDDINVKKIDEPKINPYYLMDEKQKRLKRLEVYSDLMTLKTKHGVKLSKEYTINSDFEEMEFEKDYHYKQRNKSNGVNLAKSFLLNGIQAVEFMNDKFNPFKFRLNGWHDHIASNVDDFEEVLGELYDKYKGSGQKMAPEARFIFMILFSGFTFHASQVLSKNIPGLDEAIKNNPSLLGKLQNTVYASMAKDPEQEKKNEINAKQQEMYQKMQQFKQTQSSIPQRMAQPRQVNVQVPTDVLNESFPKPFESRQQSDSLEQQMQARQKLYTNPPSIRGPTGQQNREILNKIKTMNSQKIQQNTNSALNSEADFVNSIKQQRPTVQFNQSNTIPKQTVNLPNNQSIFVKNNQLQNRLVTSETIDNTSSDSTIISQLRDSASSSRVGSRRKNKGMNISIT
jgi:hypothetical protein